MSSVKIFRCDACGNTQESKNDYDPPEGWTLVRVLVGGQENVHKDVCSKKCVHTIVDAELEGGSIVRRIDLRKGLPT